MNYTDAELKVLEAKIHTHVSTNSRDCDGTYDHEWITDGRISVFDMISTHDGSGNYTLNFDDHPVCNQILLYRLTMSAPTDEGYTAVELNECGLDCNLEDRSYRDHTAEKMGY